MALGICRTLASAGAIAVFSMVDAIRRLHKLALFVRLLV